MAAVLAQVRTAPYQRQNRVHAMKLSPGNKPVGKVKTRSTTRDSNVPVQHSAPEKQSTALPKIPAEYWQCHSLQSETRPRPKIQDFSPEPVTLKAPTSPPARHLTGRRRGTQPCSPAFCHVVSREAAPLQLCSGASPRSRWAVGGRDGCRAEQPTLCGIKGTGHRSLRRGAWSEPPGGPQEQPGTAWCTPLVSPSREALSPSV